jgi:hypothetical protein
MLEKHDSSQAQNDMELGVPRSLDKLGMTKSYGAWLNTNANKPRVGAELVSAFVC